MAYDPCAPNIVSVVARKSGHPARRHPVRHLLGRRVARWPGRPINTDACPKSGAALVPPSRLAGLAPLASPAIVTTLGMAVVGASAFGGAAMLGAPRAPGVATPVGPIIVPGGGTVVQPTSGTGTGQAGSTSMPEPGSAAILAVAMIVVLISSWVQGGRAFRGTAESRIGRLPLRSRERDPAESPDRSENLQQQPVAPQH
jgi:hypothetical protein